MGHSCQEAVLQLLPGDWHNQSPIRFSQVSQLAYVFYVYEQKSLPRAFTPSPVDHHPLHVHARMSCENAAQALTQIMLSLLHQHTY